MDTQDLFIYQLGPDIKKNILAGQLEDVQHYTKQSSPLSPSYLPLKQRNVVRQHTVDSTEHVNDLQKDVTFSLYLHLCLFKSV